MAVLALGLLAPGARAADLALSWNDNSDNETGFKIERALGAGAFAQVATVAANTTAYTDSGLEPATTYSYRVRAYNAYGDSDYSNVATATTPSVLPSNTAPAVSDILDRTIDEDAATGAIAFTIGDAETAAGSLTLSGASSNTTLVPAANIVFGGSGASRTVTVTPAANRSGTATITVTVSDGALTASDTFVVTVAAVNDGPTITNIADRTVEMGASTGAIAFTIGDAETAAGSLTLSGASSNTTLVPAANIVFGGSGASRTVTVTPAADQTGTATITVAVSDGALTASDTFVVTVNPPAGGPVITQHPQGLAVAAGAKFTLSVRAEGSGPLSYQWQVLERGTFRNLSGGRKQDLSISSTQRYAGGTYRAVVTCNGIAVASNQAVVTVGGSTVSESQVMNMSTRSLCESGDGVVILGFVVQGTLPKRVLLRMVGPRLADYGVSGTLSDPRMQLKLFDGGAYRDVAANDDWGSNANAAEIAATAALVGAFSLAEGSADSALLLDLQPGIYSVVGTDAAGAPGIAMIELYDADPAPGGSQLVNISNRGFVGTGGDIVIPGFVVSDEGPKTLLVRAAGPTLADYGVGGVLADPQIVVHRRLPGTTTDEVFATCDDWGEAGDEGDVSVAAIRVGAFPLPAGSKDAAMVITVPPGVYTLHAAGVGGTTGTALVEVYVVE